MLISGLFLPRYGLGDKPGHSGRTGDRGQDADVVPGTHPAVGTDKALKRVPLPGQYNFRGPGLGSEGILPGVVLELHVVGVDMASPADIPGGEAHDLAVFEDPVPGLEVGRGQLVARRNALVHGQGFAGQLCSRPQFDPGHDHVVIRMKPDHRRGWLCHLYLFSA